MQSQKKDLAHAGLALFGNLTLQIGKHIIAWTHTIPVYVHVKTSEEDSPM